MVFKLQRISVQTFWGTKSKASHGEKYFGLCNLVVETRQPLLLLENVSSCCSLAIFSQLLLEICVCQRKLVVCFCSTSKSTMIGCHHQKPNRKWITALQENDDKLGKMLKDPVSSIGHKIKGDYYCMLRVYCQPTRKTRHTSTRKYGKRFLFFLENGFAYGL